MPSTRFPRHRGLWWWLTAPVWAPIKAYLAFVVLMFALPYLAIRALVRSLAHSSGRFRGLR